MLSLELYFLWGKKQQHTASHVEKHKQKQSRVYHVDERKQKRLVEVSRLQINTEAVETDAQMWCIWSITLEGFCKF